MQQSGGQPEGSCGSIPDNGNVGAVVEVVAEVSDDGLEQSGLLNQDGSGGGQWQLSGQLQSIGNCADHQCEFVSGGGDDSSGDGVVGVCECEGEWCEFSDECAGNFGGVNAGDEFRCGADPEMFADGWRERGLRSASVGGEDDGFEDGGADRPGTAFISHQPAPTAGAG